MLVEDPFLSKLRPRVLELIDNIEALQEALKYPEGFLKKLAAEDGPREEGGPGVDCTRRFVCAVHGVM